MPESDRVYLTFDDGPTPGVTEWILDQLAEYRPPYARIKPSQAHRISERYNIVMWDVLSRDYSRLISPRQCLHNVTRHVRGGSIVVFHDSVKSFRNLRYALPRTLQYLQKQGLECSVIEL